MILVIPAIEYPTFFCWSFIL